MYSLCFPRALATITANTSDSWVRGSGNNQHAQLVDDDESIRLNRPAPVELMRLSGAGQLGDRTTAAHTIPTPVFGGHGFTFATARSYPSSAGCRTPVHFRASQAAGAPGVTPRWPLPHL